MGLVSVQPDPNGPQPTVDWHGTTFTGANLLATHRVSVDLSDASMDAANLMSAFFDGNTKMMNVDLSGSDLRNASFRGMP